MAVFAGVVSAATPHLDSNDVGLRVPMRAAGVAVKAISKNTVLSDFNEHRYNSL
jgi:hypothetical protein